MPHVPLLQPLLTPRIFVAPLIHHFAVGITVKSRRVTVKGPRGSLDRDFRHIDFDLSLVRLSPLFLVPNAPPTTFAFTLVFICC